MTATGTTCLIIHVPQSLQSTPTVSYLITMVGRELCYCASDKAGHYLPGSVSVLSRSWFRSSTVMFAFIESNSINATPTSAKGKPPKKLSSTWQHGEATDSVAAPKEQPAKVGNADTVAWRKPLRHKILLPYVSLRCTIPYPLYARRSALPNGLGSGETNIRNVFPRSGSSSWGAN